MSDVNNQILFELRKNVIQIPIDNDVICAICKEVMINARCAPCGCRYCLGCISKHLNEQNEYCPGQTNDCNIEMLTLNVNTINDYGINRKISKMVVQCPAENCEFIDEVRNIGSHMQVCDFNVRGTNIETEKKIKSLENKIDRMESMIKDFEDEIENLKNDKTKQQYAMMEMETDSNNCFNKIKQIEKEMTKLINNMKIFEDPEMRMISCRDWKDMTDPIHREMRENSNLQQKELCKMMDKVKEIENIQKQLENSFEMLGNKLEMMKSAKPSKKTEDDMKKTAIRKTFSWEIGNFLSTVRQNLLNSSQMISSDSFFTHKTGYKLHLELNLSTYASGIGTPIYVSYCLLEGEYDDQLLWPCKFDVRFDLINPYNNEVYCTSNIFKDHYSTHPGKMQPDFERFPVGCRLGKLEDILEIKEWRLCDKAIIKCKISFDEY